MPYLNWKSAPIQQKIQAHPTQTDWMELTLSLAPVELQALIPYLEEVFLKEGSELRLDLPGEWTVFWKRRDFESRLLVAHPQQDQWVATAALDSVYGEKWINGISALTAGQSLAIGSLGQLGSPSNLELKISVT